jgi:hypothetical protein
MKILEYNRSVNQLFINFRKVYDPVNREVLYNIPTEVGTSMKQTRLIKRCFSLVRTSKNLSDIFYIQNDLKQEDALSPLLSNFALEYSIIKVQERQQGFELNRTSTLTMFNTIVYWVKA